jgi:phage host-nuclease inhibitor protein Gam
MTTKRTSVPVMAKIEKSEAEEHLMKYGMAESTIEKIEAEIAIECAEVRAKYQVELDRNNTIKTDAQKALQLFAELNREEHFSKKKSLQMLHGTLGFRIGTPKLKMEKSFTWEVGLALIKSKEGGMAFVRTSEEIAKDELLARRDEEAVISLMNECKIQVVQDEKFYVEAKKENAT